MARKTKEGKAKKVREVMHEFKEKELHSSSGQRVTNRRQAVAIALESSGQSRRTSRKGTT